MSELHGKDSLLFCELSAIIEQGKRQLVRHINSSLNFVFWQVGLMINSHILNNQRAEYGKQIVPTVSAQLEKTYGRNFNEKNVRRMMKLK